MSVRQAQEDIDWREFVDWMLYQQLTGPLDPRIRGDWQAAVPAIAACQSSKAKFTDFLLKWHKPKPDAETLGRTLIAWAKQHGAKIVRKGQE